MVAQDPRVPKGLLPEGFAGVTCVLVVVYLRKGELRLRGWEGASPLLI